MSLTKLKRLALEAYNFKNSHHDLLVFSIACNVFGIEVYLNAWGSGVIIRSSDFFVERYRNRDGVPSWSILPR